jgi:hypothetical protein
MSMICNTRATPVRVATKGQVHINTRTKAVISCFHGFKAINSRSSFSSQANQRKMTCRSARVQASIVASKVAVLGAAGGIGQPLSMLLKMNNMVTDLALYDIANVAGVAADLSHCNTPVKVCLFFDGSSQSMVSR